MDVSLWSFIVISLGGQPMWPDDMPLISSTVIHPDKPKTNKTATINFIPNLYSDTNIMQSRASAHTIETNLVCLHLGDSGPFTAIRCGR